MQRKNERMNKDHGHCITSWGTCVDIATGLLLVWLGIHDVASVGGDIAFVASDESAIH